VEKVKQVKPDLKPCVAFAAWFQGIG
jgi:hypothetical protein